MFRQLLTNSWFPPGDVEKPSQVTVAGALDWQAKANAETNGETERRRTSQTPASWGIAEGPRPVNKLRGNRCEKIVWLPKTYKIRTGLLESWG